MEQTIPENIYCIDMNWIDSKISEYSEIIDKLRKVQTTFSNNTADIVCNERDAFYMIKNQLKPITKFNLYTAENLDAAYEEGYHLCAFNHKDYLKGSDLEMSIMLEEEPMNKEEFIKSIKI
ncbi:MAG: hypothetical protein ABIP51_21540 [Bacteroidia bacterium]